VSPLSAADAKAGAEFHREVRQLRDKLTATVTAANDLLTRLEAIRIAAEELPPGDEAVRAKVRKLTATVKLSIRTLTGDGFLASRGENAPVSVAERLSYAANATRGAVHPPTGTQKQAKADVAKQLAAEAAKLRAMLDTDVPPLEAALADAGVPYTPPGKLPK
jgi:hypothetical protein